MKDHQRIRVKAPSQSAVPPIQVKSLQSRPFAPTPNPAIQQQSAPSIQAQLDGAKRFGYDLSNISVFPSASAAVQPKLTVGQPGDKYEQEADQVATDVISQINTSKENSSPKLSHTNNLKIQSLSTRSVISAASENTIQRVGNEQNDIPNIPDIQKPEAFLKFISKRDTYPYFASYCERLFATENLYFWHGVKHFLKNPNRTDARALYDRYVSDQAKEQVNLPSKIKQELTQAYQNDWVGLLVIGLEDAQRSIFDTMLADRWRDFIKSKEYEEYLMSRQGLKGVTNKFSDWKSGLAEKKKGHV